jgi:hypothetical protein
LIGQPHVPVTLNPRGKNPGYTLDRRLGGLQSQSGRHEEVKILALHLDSNSDPSVVQSAASRYTDCGIQARKQIIIIIIIIIAGIA